MCLLQTSIYVLAVPSETSFLNGIEGDNRNNMFGLISVTISNTFWIPAVPFLFCDDDAVEFGIDLLLLDFNSFWPRVHAQWFSNWVAPIKLEYLERRTQESMFLKGPKWVYHAAELENHWLLCKHEWIPPGNYCIKSLSPCWPLLRSPRIMAFVCRCSAVVKVAWSGVIFLTVFICFQYFFFPSNKWAFMTVCKYLFCWPPEAWCHFLPNGFCGLVVCNTNSGNICVLGYIFAYFFMANIGFFRFFYIHLGMSIIS